MEKVANEHKLSPVSKQKYKEILNLEDTVSDNRGQRDNSQSLLNRTHIARTVFAAAESMGMADRELIEQLTGQVIKRLEKSKPLLIFP